VGALPVAATNCLTLATPGEIMAQLVEAIEGMKPAASSRRPSPAATQASQRDRRGHRSDPVLELSADEDGAANIDFKHPDAVILLGGWGAAKTALRWNAVEPC
jgi:hypothetical protein